MDSRCFLCLAVYMSMQRDTLYYLITPYLFNPMTLGAMTNDIR